MLITGDVNYENGRCELVSGAYRSATIALAVISLISIVVIILLIIYILRKPPTKG